MERWCRRRGGGEVGHEPGFMPSVAAEEGGRHGGAVAGEGVHSGGGYAGEGLARADCGGRGLRLGPRGVPGLLRLAMAEGSWRLGTTRRVADKWGPSVGDRERRGWQGPAGGGRERGAARAVLQREDGPRPSQRRKEVRKGEAGPAWCAEVAAGPGKREEVLEVDGPAKNWPEKRKMGRPKRKS